MCLFNGFQTYSAEYDQLAPEYCKLNKIKQVKLYVKQLNNVKELKISFVVLKTKQVYIINFRNKICNASNIDKLIKYYIGIYYPRILNVSFINYVQ